MSVRLADFQRDLLRTRALSRISGARDPSQRYGQRFSAAREADLLAYAATLADEDILDWPMTGPAMLRWIRTHQPTTNTDTTLAWVMKSYGWRVEVFWNSGGGLFTARLVDRDGNLMPRGEPIGAGAGSPGDALADLHDAVLEWA